MNSPHSIELSPTEASERIHQDLQEARLAFRTASLESALDRYIGALGLALQLGPAATEWVLAEVMDAAREMARQNDANGLSALGPGLLDLTDQVQGAGALPPTEVMKAWAMFASGLGVLFGQLGLVLAIAPERRTSMLANAFTQANLLDSATGNLFGLVDWLSTLSAGLHDDEPGRGYPP